MLSPKITRQVIAAATTDLRTPATASTATAASLAVLTNREREVAVEVARGLPNAEIASRLYMSVATVKATITRIFQKMGTTNRVQLALIVREAGLI